MTEEEFTKREEAQRKLWDTVSNRFKRYQNKCSLTAWTPFVCKEGWFLLIRFVLLLIILFWAPDEISLLKIVLGFLTLYFFIDIIAVNTAIAFVAPIEPINNLRSFSLTFFTFTHVIIVFAIFYRFLEHEFEGGLCAMQALYYSVVTITTLGYGDFHPQRWGAAAQLVTSLEVLVGLFFVLGVFTRIGQPAKSVEKV